MKTGKQTARSTSLAAARSAPPGAISPRRRVLEAARSHFFSHGFRTVTMDDLAAELGMSKKTLYAHFPSKEALLEAVIKDKFARVSATLETIQRQQPDDFAARLQAMLHGMQRELAELKPPFVRDMRLKAPHIFKRLEQRRARLIETHFSGLFQTGQRSGDVRRDIPVRLMIETILSAIQAIMNPQKLEELGLSPKEAFAGVIGIVLRGVLLPQKGKR
jgi:AcrR family transcriptional regulator